MLEPKLDILVLGIGDHGGKYDKNIVKYLRSSKINVEILPTDQACSTFNFLNAERRMVAAGLIPPTYMHLDNDEDLQIRARLERGGGKLFELKHGYSEDPSADIPGEFSEALENRKHLFPGVGAGQKDSNASEGKSQEGKDREGDKKER